MSEYVVSVKSKPFRTLEGAKRCFNSLELSMEFEMKELVEYENEDVVYDHEFSYENKPYSIVDLEDIIEEIEEFLGGYFGEENLFDELCWISNEMMRVRKEKVWEHKALQSARKSLDAIAEEIGLAIDTEIAAPFEIEKYVIDEIRRLKEIG